MNVLQYLVLFVRWTSAVYFLRFLEYQGRKMITGTIRPFFSKTGALVFLLVASAAVAAPRFFVDKIQTAVRGAGGAGTGAAAGAGDGVQPSGSAESLWNVIDPMNWVVLPMAGLTVGLSTPTEDLDTVGLARYYGYEAEHHWVITQDGYILGLHRLPTGRKIDKSNKPRPVVLLQHAWVLSSRDYLVLGPEKSLAFILADAGYDVWLCNLRGNTYSRKHTTLSPDSPDFWDFSFTEHGVYDLPAVFDYALQVSGKRKLHYIGHSIGTINFFVLGSKRPEVLKKVATYTALAPVNTLMHCRSALLRFTLENSWPVVNSLEQLGIHELLPHYAWITQVGHTVCRDQWVTQKTCTGFLFALAGTNPQQFNTSVLPEILTHAPAGSSLKTFKHFTQNFRNGFRDFDYGTAENVKRYNSYEPPLFDLTKINVSTQIFYGLNDLMAEQTDAQKICKTLPNVFRCEAVEDKNFNHIDFIWGSNAHKIVYPKVLKGLRRYDQSDAFSIQP